MTMLEGCQSVSDVIANLKGDAAFSKELAKEITKVRKDEPLQFIGVEDGKKMDRL